MYFSLDQPLILWILYSLCSDSASHHPKSLAKRSIPGHNLGSFRHLRLGGLLMLRMDDMNAGLSRREPLNVTAEPGRDLLETHIFDVTKSVPAKNRCNASWVQEKSDADQSC
jgi:hypothetical protein